MTDYLRRSSRRTTKRVSNFQVGDVVEVERNGDISLGRLAYNLTEGLSPNARWLVTFDHEPSLKDEELYERDLGKRVSKAGEPIPASRIIDNSNHSKKTKRSIRTNGSGVKVSSSSEAEDVREKKVTFEPKSSLPVSETDSRVSKDRVSAREQRSLRRQKKIVGDPTAQQNLNNKRNFTSTNQSNHNGHRQMKKARRETEEEVIKVQLLTGTLYLYRGIHRRAEFIRRV